MPQLGFENVDLTDVEECGNQLDTPGVVCIIGLIGDLKGNAIFAMDINCAMKIASCMMGGMELEAFDELSQSAVAELGNMLAGTACTEYSKIGLKVDVSTPTLMHGTFTVSASQDHVTKITLRVDDMPFLIYVALEKK
jgi:chemotaxis protein CheX